MRTKRQLPNGLSRESIARAACFALPFVVVAGLIVYSQYVDTNWQSVAVSHPQADGAPSLESVPQYRLHPDAAPASPAKSAASLQAQVRPQNLTRPLQALPQWHRFPPLPDGITAKGPVGAEVLLLVDTDGAVMDAAVLHTSGADWLDQQAIDWVKANWRYRPALAGTKPVVATTSAVVVFTPKNARR